jgi:uncharacterized protein (TIGR02466 family)
MNIIPLFSTPLYENSLDIDSEVLEFVKGIDYVPCNPSDILEGVMSVNNYILEVPQLKTFKNQIEQVVDNFLKVNLKFTQIYFNITTSWVVKHNENHRGKSHFHRNSLFSGVVYLQVSDNSGDIIFLNSSKNPLYPTEIELQATEYNVFNALSWAITPKQNSILIFPSHVKHKVTPNKSNKDRYVIAFNIFPSGILDKGNIAELHLL